jgi:hypothetical protein
MRHDRMDDAGLAAKLEEAKREYDAEVSEWDRAAKEKDPPSRPADVAVRSMLVKIARERLETLVAECRWRDIEVLP